MKVAGLSRWILGFSVAVAVVATAGAQGPEGMPGMGPHRPPMERAMGQGGLGGDHGRWWNDPKAIEKLKLTDSQRKSMDEIYQQHRENLIDLHAALDKQELAMEPLIRADQPDEGRILQQIDRVAQARAELEKANARMLLGLRRQLTPEQWKQMEADRAARHSEMGPGGPGRRGPGHMGSGPGSAEPPPPPGAGAGMAEVGPNPFASEPGAEE